jgi:hypothetical protein
VVFSALLERFADQDDRVRHAAVAALEVVSPRGGAEQVPVSKGTYSALYAMILDRMKQVRV